MSQGIEATRPRRFRPYPEYRNSGVEWLSRIPAHWSIERLKNLATLNDEVLPESTDPSFELDYVDISSVDAIAGINGTESVVFERAPSRARRVVRSGDVIVSTVRTYLRAIAAIDNPESNLIVSTGFAVIRPRRMETSFACYAFRAPHFVERVVANSVGVSYPAINASSLSCFRVPFPEVTEQRAIAAFLDRETARIDALVAKKQRLIELLQEKRTALITRAVTRGLDPDVPMKDSGVEWLGAIPVHWRLNPLKRVSPEITVGVVVNPSRYVRTEGVPFLYGSDIEEGRIVSEAARRMSEEDSRFLSKSRLLAGDLVCVRVGAPGVTAVVPPGLAGANCASVVIVRHADTFDSQWLCYVMNSRLVRHQIELVQYGAAQEQFNVSHAVEFVIPLAPPTEQSEIAAFLDCATDRIDALIDKIKRAIDHLKEFRTALISAAVTGKIDVQTPAQG